MAGFSKLQGGPKWSTVDLTDFSELLKLQFCGGTWRRRQVFDMRGTVTLVRDHPARLLSATPHQENQSNYEDKKQIMFGVAGIAEHHCTDFCLDK